VSMNGDFRQSVRHHETLIMSFARRINHAHGEDPVSRLAAENVEFSRLIRIGDTKRM